MEELALRDYPVERFLDIPSSYPGRKIWGISFDGTGVEIHFERGDRLIFDDHVGTGEFTFDESTEVFLDYVGASLYRIDLQQWDDHLGLFIRTDWGILEFRIYDAGDIRCEELKNQ